MEASKCCWFWIFMATLLRGTVAVFTVNECDTNGEFINAENQPTSLTCRGLWYSFNIYWSITTQSAGKEITVSRCYSGNTQCRLLQASQSYYYSVSRTSTTTTFGFPYGMPLSHDGAVIKCARLNNDDVATCRLRVVKARQVQDCSDNNIVQLGFGDTSLIRCSGLFYYDSISWTVNPENGQTVSVSCGSCSWGDKCPPCTTTSSFRRSEYSYLITEGVSTLAGKVLQCASGRINRLCKLDVPYSLPQCAHDGLLEVSETQPTDRYISCQGLEFYENVFWTSANADGSGSALGYCRNVTMSYSCRNLTAGFTVLRNRTASWLTVGGSPDALRTLLSGKTLTCVRNDNFRSTSCKVRVVYPAEVSSVSLTLANWTLTGVAVVSKVFDSENNVTCLWTVTGPLAKDVLTRTPPELSPFVPEAGGTQNTYYSGQCIMELPVSDPEGVYGVSVLVLPGGTSVDVGNVTIASPGPLTPPDRYCPPFAAAGSDVTCRCRHNASAAGSPPARVTWLGDASTDTLKLRDVNMTLNGSVFTCISQWGPPGRVASQSVNYTLLVAYGPSNASVSRQDGVTNDTDVMTLTCAIDDVYPSAGFNWSVPCLTLNTTSKVSSCTVRPEMTPGGAEITCIAFNSEFPTLLSTGTFSVYGRQVSEEDRGDSSNLTAVAAGAAVGAVGGVVVAVIAVVVLKRRRSRGAVKKDSPKPPVATPNNDFVEYINDIYEVQDDEASPPSQPPPASAASALTGSSPVKRPEAEAAPLYANTAAVTVAGNGDVYAQVVKPPKKPAEPRGRSRENPGVPAQPCSHKAPPSDVYAQVKPKRKGANPDLTKVGRNSPVQPDPENEDNYANYPLPPPAELSDVYMNMMESPPLDTDREADVTEAEVTSDVEEEEEYSNLQFTRQTDTPDVDCHYNHLGQI